MKNPANALLDRCKTGFPLWQKWLMTGAVVFYGVFPIDVIPDVLPPFTYADDLFLVYLLVRVWRSPTLPKSDGDEAELVAAPIHQPTTRPQSRKVMVHREHIGGAR